MHEILSGSIFNWFICIFTRPIFVQSVNFHTINIRTVSELHDIVLYTLLYELRISK